MNKIRKRHNNKENMKNYIFISIWFIFIHMFVQEYKSWTCIFDFAFFSLRSFWADCNKFLVNDKIYWSDFWILRFFLFATRSCVVFAILDNRKSAPLKRRFIQILNYTIFGNVKKPRCPGVHSMLYMNVF